MTHCQLYWPQRLTVFLAHSVTHGPTDDELSQVMKTQQHVTLYTLLCFCSQKATCSCKICGYFDLVSNMLLEIEQPQHVAYKITETANVASNMLPSVWFTLGMQHVTCNICSYFDIVRNMLPDRKGCCISDNMLLCNHKCCRLWGFKSHHTRGNIVA